MKLKIRKIRKHKKHPATKRFFLKNLVRNFNLWFLTTFSPKALIGLRVASWTLVTVILMLLVYTGERSGVWFKASILEAPQPFSGTVMPMSKVPNWATWMNGQPDMTVRFDQIPDSQLIDLPPYDLNVMKFPNERLVWGDRSQDIIRNTKITYSVVYLGNYKLEHDEGVGSHLAVDIKTPIGTPVRAIANGKVVKVSTQSSGFGHHVVIQHTGVPDPDNPGQRTTLYSAFNHLSDIHVSEGENVIKGQVIALSGNTGTSTTPHLHFQIDRDSAPWHPYWPFNSKESSDAGLSFFQAVNAGLGLGNAKANTVNPMRFVTQNMGAFSVATAGDTSVPPSGTTTNAVEPAKPDPVTVAVVTPPVVTTQEPEKPVEVVSNPLSTGSPSDLFEFKITGETVALVGSSVTLIVTDEKNQMATLSDDDTIDATIEGSGNLLQKRFSKANFVNNVLKLYVRNDSAGEGTVTIGKSAQKISWVTEAKSVSSFRFEHDGGFQPNIVEKVKIIALDDQGSLAPAVNFNGFVEVKTTQGEAIITPNFLRKEDFRGGVADIKVTSTKTDPVVLRVQNGALIGQSEQLRSENGMVFTDIKSSHPNYVAIKYLKDQGISNGYKDGTFRPNETVNRAEALKMLMAAFGSGSASNKDAIAKFKDVDKSAWYASTLALALEQGIVSGYKDGTFKPANTVTRAEYLKLILKSAKVEPSGSISKPYRDVSLNDWFAPYAYLANKLNLLKPADNFNPGGGMTRAGVAETIYRLKIIQANNWVTYSK